MITWFIVWFILNLIEFNISIDLLDMTGKLTTYLKLQQFLIQIMLKDYSHMVMLIIICVHMYLLMTFIIQHDKRYKQTNHHEFLILRYFLIYRSNNYYTRNSECRFEYHIFSYVCFFFSARRFYFHIFRFHFFFSILSTRDFIVSEAKNCTSYIFFWFGCVCGVYVVEQGRKERM